MNRVFHPSPRQNVAPTLLVLVPGFDMSAADFVAHGFVAALQEIEAPVDLLIAEPALDSYMDGTIAQSLLAAIDEQRCRRPYCGLWLAGISLGCFGALLAASAATEPIDGIVLLSPYLGSPGFIAEIERAGGITAWQPGAIAESDGERRVLAWLRSHRLEDRRRPRLQLGYGRSDRFVATANLLAGCLREAQVHVVDGGHDWPTWTALWRQLLAAQPFSAP